MTTEEPIAAAEEVVAEAAPPAEPRKRMRKPNRPEEVEYKSQVEALQESSEWWADRAGDTGFGRGGAGGGCLRDDGPRGTELDPERRARPTHAAPQSPSTRSGARSCGS